MKTHLRQVIAYTFAFAALFFTTQAVLAADLKIPVDRVRVYSQPDTSSKSLGMLPKGAVVKMSNQKVPGFYKILVNTKSGSQIGYISTADLAPGMGGGSAGTAARGGSRGSQQKSRPYTVGMANRTSVALKGGVNYQRQGERAFTGVDSAGVAYSAAFSALSGLSTVFGLSVQFPFMTKWAAKVFVEMKTVSVSGTSAYTNTSVAAVATDTFLKESFLDVGASAQYYFSPYFWAGAGFQMDKANSGTIQFGSLEALSLSGSDLPTFFNIFGVAGYDFQMGSSFFITPEIKLGVLTSKPMIIEVDGMLNLSYAF